VTDAELDAKFATKKKVVVAPGLRICGGKSTRRLIPEVTLGDNGFNSFRFVPKVPRPTLVELNQH